jgi:hypothetical protein
MTPWEDDLKCIPEPYRLSLAKYPDGETAWANSPDMVALLWYVAVVCRSTSDGPEAVTREIERAKQHLKQVSRYPGTSQVNHAAVRLNDELCRILECAPWKTPLHNAAVTTIRGTVSVWVFLVVFLFAILFVMLGALRRAPAYLLPTCPIATAPACARTVA